MYIYKFIEIINVYVTRARVDPILSSPRIPCHPVRDASRRRKSRSGPGACWPTSLSAHQQWWMQQARIQLRFSGGRKCPFWGSFCSLAVSQSEERGEGSCWNSVSGPTTWICHRNGLTMMTLNMASWHVRCPAGGFHIHRSSRWHGKPICAAFHEWWLSSSIWEWSVAGRMVVWGDIKTTGAIYFTSPVMLLTWSWLPLTASPMYREPACHRLDWVGSCMTYGFCWLKMEKLSPGNAHVGHKYLDFGPNNCWIFIVYTYPGRPWRVFTCARARISKTPHHKEYMPVACGLTPDEIRQRTLQLLISTDSDALMRTVLKPPSPAVPNTPPPPVPDTRSSLQDLADKHSKAGGTPQTFVQCLPRYFTPELLLSCQQLQQGSPDWTSQRKGRITASSMYAVTCFMGRKPDGALVKQIINGSDVSTPAMTFGHDNEDLARQLYLLGHQQQYPGVRIDQTGLHMDPDRPFLAASPDGLVHCPECGPEFLEVKCSYKYRDLEAQEAALQKGNHFQKQDNVISLHENSPWNYQIQCQLGVCRRTWRDLVLFTEKGILITKVITSPVLWQEIKEKGEYFFQKYVLPKIM